MDWCVLCYSVHVPITAAACVGLKSDHQVVASGTEHINADRCLNHNITEHLGEDLELNIQTVVQ